MGGQLHPTDDIEIENSPSPSVKGGEIKIPSPLAGEVKGEGGFLEEKIKRNREINLSFGQAIQEWNKHNYKKAVQMFRKHVEEFPDSPWASESELHVGCDATYNGRYTEAAEMFMKIINENKDRSHSGAKMLANKAKQRLGILKVLQANFSEATQLFAELKKESTDWRHRTYASHWIQRISKYKSNELALLNCGTEALAHVLRKSGKESESREIMEVTPGSLKGNSIKDLKILAGKYGFNIEGLKLSAADLMSVPLPAIVQISPKHDNDRGHYWVLEQIDHTGFMFFDPQSGGRFSQKPDEFLKEWDGNAIVFSNGSDLPGTKLTGKEMETIYGACCGAPRPEDPLGDPDGPGPPPPGPPPPQPPGPCGSPIWKVNMLNMNLYVTDIPLWYRPATGPAVTIQLSYNSESAIAYNESFGNKWQFNYGSYLIVDTSGTVILFMPDGRRDVYNPDGSGGFTKPYEVYNELIKIAENHFELRFPDGTVYVYNIPSGTNSLQPFLVEIRDVHGQSLTFTYNADVQLTTITDAEGKNTTLTYNQNDLIDRVTDPFGRSATFEYNIYRNLTKITDMGGYWARFSYDADVYFTSIEKQQGIWNFYTEPSEEMSSDDSIYPKPGDDMWANYRITVTNPSGDKEEYMYYASCAFGTCASKSWYVSPRDYIEWESQTVNNYRSNVPHTLYIIQSAVRTGEISKITYPEGGYVEYGYDSKGNRTSIKDSYGNTTLYSYNSMGRVTSITDPKGTVTTLNYAGNGFDLITIQDSRGSINLAYNDTHDVASMTDRLGNTTSFTYNNYGKLASSTDAIENTTTFSYNANNQLEQILKEGNVVESFTYDNIGRLDTRTSSTGLSLDYDYNNLDNVTKITYPDGNFISYTYSLCCPHLVDSVTDRSGRVTSYKYNKLVTIQLRVKNLLAF